MFDLLYFGLHLKFPLHLFAFLLPQVRYRLAQTSLSETSSRALLLHLGQLGGAVKNPCVGWPGDLLTGGVGIRTGRSTIDFSVSTLGRKKGAMRSDKG
jgi:hypothetical protein